MVFETRKDTVRPRKFLFTLAATMLAVWCHAHVSPSRRVIWHEIPYPCVAGPSKSRVELDYPGRPRYAGFARLTFFRSAARGLHVPASLTLEPTKHEARKRRASERPRVGCCEELGRSRIVR